MNERKIADDLLRFRVYEALLVRAKYLSIYLTGYDADEIFWSVKAKIEAEKAAYSRKDDGNAVYTGR